MPWTPSDAAAKTHKADSTQKERVWSKVANDRLSKTGDEGLAIREANSVIARIGKGSGGYRSKDK